MEFGDLREADEYQHPIFRVHDILRNVNKMAYEPEIISIGPYHWGKESLSAMEKHKLRYLSQVLDKKVKEAESLSAMVGRLVGSFHDVDRGDERNDHIREKICKSFLQEMRDLAKEARKKYDGSFTLDEDQFVNMLLLDGCFIIQLLRKNSMPELVTEDDPIFRVDWMHTSLQRDLLLLENQLPFKVLCKLFELIDEKPNRYDRLAFLAYRFFGNAFHGLNGKIPESFQRNDAEHLLDLIHSLWNPLFSATLNLPGTGSTKQPENNLNRRFLSAKRMLENGVVFKISKTQGSLFAIEFPEKCSFKFRELIFQQLVIEGRTETFFRNFIAYEQYFKNSKGDFVTNLVDFFGKLIDSEEDVELLCYHGVLDNKLGSSKSVVDLVTKINQCVTIENPNSLYGHIYHELNLYCTNRSNYWKTKLWESYCNPWGIASIVLAKLGICLSVITLVFTILTYKFTLEQTE